MRSKLHVLDYSPKDVGVAIRKLDELHRAGKIQGMMFVCKVADRKRPLVGAAGCCIDDPMAAMGAAAYLNAAVIDANFNG